MDLKESFQQFRQNFICPICLDLFQDPCSLPCQHVFCRDCLQRLRSEREVSCPNCRKYFAIRNLRINFTYNSLLETFGNFEHKFTRFIEIQLQCYKTFTEIEWNDHQRQQQENLQKVEIENKSLLSELKTTNLNNEQLKKELSKIGADLSAVTRMKNEAENQMKKLSEELEKTKVYFRNALKQMKECERKMKEEIKIMSHQNKNLREVVEEMNKRLNDANEHIKQLNVKNEDLMLSLEDRNCDMKAYGDMISKQRQQISTTNCEMEATFLKLRIQSNLHPDFGLKYVLIIRVSSRSIHLRNTIQNLYDKLEEMKHDKNKLVNECLEKGDEIMKLRDVVTEERNKNKMVNVERTYLKISMVFLCCFCVLMRW